MACKECIHVNLCKKYHDPFTYDILPSVGCDDFKDSKPMTNADRIRAMNDEELEDVIVAISLGYEPWCDHHCKMQGEDNCNICLKKWLQKPAEGD